MGYLSVSLQNSYPTGPEYIQYSCYTDEINFLQIERDIADNVPSIISIVQRPSFKRYKSVAIAKRLTDRTITLTWDENEPANKDGVESGTLTLIFRHQSETLTQEPVTVLYVSKENPDKTEYPNFAFLQHR
jgi:hypothetical protein